MVLERDSNPLQIDQKSIALTIELSKHGGTNYFGGGIRERDSMSRLSRTGGVMIPWPVSLIEMSVPG